MTEQTTAAFADLSRRRQLVRLRRAALAALPQFGIDPATDLRRLRLVNHEFNTTYRVDTVDGRSMALRININSINSVGEVVGEVAWVRALATESSVRVPRPVPSLVPTPAVRCDGLDRDLAVVLYEWLDAPDLGERASARQIRELGRTAALLHQHGATWRPPPPARRPKVTSWLMDSRDHLSSIDTPWWSDELRVPITMARHRVEEVVGDVLGGPGVHLVHADLHGWNAKWLDGTIAVFDFDDCAVTSPVFDLAISAFYLRDRPELERALLDGYSSARALPAFTDEQWEALLASRSLLMLNDVVSSATSFGADFVPRYARTTARRMQHYLDTGRFELSPGA